MEKQTKEYIKKIFEGYKARKNRNELYKIDDDVPKIIITSYLSLVDKPTFKHLITKYKKNYIFCESRVEQNITKEEQQGLSDVYDYIQNFDFNRDNFNVFVTSLMIHNKLYRYCGDGTFGGKLRESTAILNDLNIEVEPPEDAKRIFNSYIAKGDYISEKYNNGDIFGYISDCVKLNVELIKLQPFADGNKRTFRSLLNLLFKRINIPPVYIEINERDEYKRALIQAMKATKEEDYNDIIQFYYYKICDSIINLDIKHSQVLELEEIEEVIRKKI